MGPLALAWGLFLHRPLAPAPGAAGHGVQNDGQRPCMEAERQHVGCDLSFVAVHRLFCFFFSAISAKRVGSNRAARFNLKVKTKKEQSHDNNMPT